MAKVNRPVDSELAAKASRLRGAGMGIRKIATALEVSETVVREALALAHQNLRLETSPAAALERIDNVVQAMSRKALAGDVKAATALLNAERLRQRTLKDHVGLDSWRLDLDLPSDGEMP